MYIRYFPLTFDVKGPERAHVHDAGLDFFMPTITEEYIQNFKNPGLIFSKENEGFNLIIPAHHNLTIPSRIKIEIPPGYMGLFLNKSGVASKKNLLIGAQVIDSYYSGEVYIDLHNTGNYDVKIESGMKLAQMVIIPIVHAQPIESADDDLYVDFTEEEKRGEGGFGSTDKVVN